MIVSNFSVGTTSGYPKRRRSTYNLQITNLETVTLIFTIEIVVDPGGEVGRTVSASERAAFADGLRVQGNMAAPLTFRKYGAALTGEVFVEIGAKRSQVVTLTTLTPNQLKSDSVQGYTSLRLQPSRIGYGGYLHLQTQLDHPAKVVLHASHEYSREGGATPVAEVTGVTRYLGNQGDDLAREAVALACGAAEQEIPAESPYATSVAAFMEDLRGGQIEPAPVWGIQRVPREEHAGALLDLLLNLRERRDIDALNRALGDLGSGLQVMPKR